MRAAWIVGLLFSVAVGIVPVHARTDSLPMVTITWFYELGCQDCVAVSNEVLPELQQRVEGFYQIERRDVGVKSNYLELVHWQEQFGIKNNESVAMVVDGRAFLNGIGAIRTGLVSCVEQRIEERLTSGGEPEQAPSDLTSRPQVDSMVPLRSRFAHFTPALMMLNGLADGINPCAISTLVFFMSLLAVAKVQGRGLIAMGVSYCLASFLTYTALGFGLLRVLHLFIGFKWLRYALNGGMFLLLLVLAALSFRDAYRYRKTGSAGSVTLQIPDRIKLKMHAIMRGGLGLGSMTLGGFVIGTTVTALESVCTGQLYVPTLVYVIQGGHSGAKALSYLLLYNAMFITPLVLVFILTYFGLRTRTLLNWSKMNVPASKTLLGVVFLLLAATVLLM
jgi:hypothetical protein